MELPETTKDITVGWLNQALHKNGLLGKSNIVSLKHERMGVGQGFQSDIARLSLSYDRDLHRLPETIVAKLPTSHPPTRAVALRRNLYEREIRFFTEIAPRSPVRTPNLIFAAIDSEKQRYVLLLEDFSFAAPADPELRGLSYEQAKIISQKIADFHARWWDDSDLFSFTWMPKQQGPGAFPSIDLFRSNWETCTKNEDFINALPEGGWEAGLKIYDKYRWLVENAPDNNLTIRHNDLRADNILFDLNMPDNPIIVLDWAMASIGRGAADLAFMLGFSLTTELRRQVEKDILNSYFERICSKGVSGYTFDECWTDYLKGFLLLSTIIVGQFAVTDYSDPRAKRLVHSALQRWFTAILDNDATKTLP